MIDVIEDVRNEFKVKLTDNFEKEWIVNIFLDNFYKDNCKRYCTGV